MYRFLIIIIVVITGWIAPASGQNSNTLFQEGINAYSEQNYSLAMMKFESIIDSGEESGELLYNMGNIAYKQKDYPLAILYYERAKLYLPSDQDLEANLALANAHIIDKIEPLPELFYEKWWDAVVISFSPDNWGIITLVLLAVFLSLLLLFWFSRTVVLKKTWFYAGVITLVLFIFSLLVSLESNNRLTAHDHAIVFKPSVTAKSSPFSDSIDVFVVHEGTKVALDNQKGDWVRIRLSNGNVGWVHGESLEII